MSFVAPLWLVAAAAVGVGVVVAHLFTATVPPRDVLPTVRFVPESAPSTVLRSRRITDWLLLAVRLLVVTAFGLALAGAHLRRSAPARVVLLDASRAVGDVRMSIDSAASLKGELIVFDSAARRVTEPGTVRQTNTHGSLSTAVAAAHRLIARASDGRERTELVIVSPVVREEVDSATAPLIAMWAGPVRFVRVTAAQMPKPASWEVRANGDDPVAAALSGLVRPAGPASVRVVRGGLTRADTLFAHSGGALVAWPVTPAGTLSGRSVADSAQAVVGAGHVVVAQFARGFMARGDLVYARWADGEPAAAERAIGDGCIREVAIPVDAVGDVALRSSFRALAASMLAPCGGAREFGLADLSEVTGSAGSSPASPVGNDRRGASPVPTDSLAIWLAALALLTLIAEQALRRRPRVA